MIFSFPTHGCPNHIIDHFVVDQKMVDRSRSRIELVNNALRLQEAQAESSDLPFSKCKCCCSTIHIKLGTFLVAFISAFFIVSNFIIKIAGYSETAWDWELLFFVVDGIAVVSLMYGVYTERAAFLQPFVVLSIVTTSFLILLAAYLASALVNSNSFAGQDFEMELHKRLSNAAHLQLLQLREVQQQWQLCATSSMVTVVAAIGFISICVGIVVHFWFVYLAVQCAKYFREIDKFSTREE